MKHTCSICTIIKDEVQYLDEWINYNLNKVGAEHIYIYEDLESESHKEITDKYKDKVSLFYIKDIMHDIDCEQKQITTFKYFLDKYKDKLDFVAFIDIDEFIDFEENYSMEQLMNDFEDYNGVYLYWKTYGANQQIYNDPSKGVLEHFTTLADTLDCDCVFDFKTVLNTKKKGSSMKTHHEAYDGVNTEFSYDLREKTYSKAWINHYFTKSWEEWLYRFTKRGDIVSGHRKLEQFFETNKDMAHLESELVNEAKIKYNITDKFLEKMEHMKELDREEMRKMKFEDRVKMLRERAAERHEGRKHGKSLFFEHFEKFKQMQKEKENKQEN